MSIKPLPSDPVASAKRKSIAQRRIGIGNQCACGENRPAALIAGSDPMICEECRRHKKGHSRFDQHHVAGRANHALTIPVPANDHIAVLSERQYCWPKVTRENADKSPLLAGAGCIRGLFDSLVYLLEKLLLWIPPFLENLDAFLTEHLGKRWWCNETYIQFTNKGETK